MNFINTSFKGLIICEPKILKDDRGYFFESFNQKTFHDSGIHCQWLQDNQSKSCYGVVRGLHFQAPPFAQSKLVRVLDGVIWDVVVDIRFGSSTFGQWYGIELSSQNKLQLFIPAGFAHGFSVLSEEATVLYKCDNLYDKASERGILFSDTAINIDWKIPADKMILSEKDKKNPGLSEIDNCFQFS